MREQLAAGSDALHRAGIHLGACRRSDGLGARFDVEDSRVLEPRHTHVPAFRVDVGLHTT